MTLRYFGTDGIRGTAGTGLLAPEPALRLGAAIAHVLGEAGGADCRIVLGRDTRPSGPRLAAALTEGLTRAGAEVLDAGVLPTAGVARLVRSLGARLGVVLSASHNPPEDNGVKLFAADGSKAGEAFEAQVEARYDEAAFEPRTLGAARPATPYPEAPAAYLDALTAELGGPGALAGLTIALDAANGAASSLAPALFERLGAGVVARRNEGDGARINAGGGALAPEALAAEIRAGTIAADLGAAFDGDADRAILVDALGNVRDGDYCLAIWALQLARHDALSGGTVVSTTMANLGLERALASAGLRLERTDVGDKHVAARMREAGFVLGGEQSGHILFFGNGPDATTGDGLLTAGHLARVVHQTQTPLAELARVVTKYPQVLLNLPVRDKPPLASLPGVAARIERARQTLGAQLDGEARQLADARIVVRYSGTEPLARVMIEGADRTRIQAEAEAIAAAIHTAIGVSTR